MARWVLPALDFPAPGPDHSRRVATLMLGSLGLPEILFILVLALLVFGPKRLPQVGRTLGKALGEFRRATTDLKRSIDDELRAEPSSTDRPPETVPQAGSDDRSDPEASSAEEE